MSLTPGENLLPVSLIPVVHLDLRLSPRMFEKIRNGPSAILWGWGETDSSKKPEAKNLVTLSFKSEGWVAKLEGWMAKLEGCVSKFEERVDQLESWEAKLEGMGG